MVKVELLVFEKLLSAQYFFTLCLKVTKLDIADAPLEWIFPINVQVTWSKVKVKVKLLV